MTIKRSAKANYDISQLSFLIVDDNKFMRVILTNALKALGVYKFWEADDGAHALKQLNQTAPDIIICDWQMEPLNGMEFAQMVRNEKDGLHRFIPIIMVTAYGDADKVQQARDVGITEFVIKPISASALYKRIISIIEHPRDFVKTPRFFGPDRRRQTVNGFAGPFRRAKDREHKAAKDQENNAVQAIKGDRRVMAMKDGSIPVQSDTTEQTDGFQAVAKNNVMN